MCLCVGATTLGPFYYIILLSLYVCLFLLLVFQPRRHRWPTPSPDHQYAATTTRLHSTTHGQKDRNYINKDLKCKTKWIRSLRVVVISLYIESASTLIPHYPPPKAFKRLISLNYMHKTLHVHVLRYLGTHRTRDTHLYFIIL